VCTRFKATHDSSRLTIGLLLLLLPLEAFDVKLARGSTSSAGACACAGAREERLALLSFAPPFSFGGDSFLLQQA
jgi:hypothetical protein